MTFREYAQSLFNPSLRQVNDLWMLDADWFADVCKSLESWRRDAAELTSFCQLDKLSIRCLGVGELQSFRDFENVWESKLRVVVKPFGIASLIDAMISWCDLEDVAREQCAALRWDRSWPLCHAMSSDTRIDSRLTQGLKASEGGALAKGSTGV